MTMDEGLSKLVRVTPRAKAFIDAYLGPARLNAAEAARMAGYSHPSSQGASVRKRLAHIIDAEELKLAAKTKLSVAEAESILCEIARDQHHKDRLKAVELVLKVHGQLADKLNITLDKNQLVKELELALASLARQEIKSLPMLPIPTQASDNKPYRS